MDERNSPDASRPSLREQFASDPLTSETNGRGVRHSLASVRPSRRAGNRFSLIIAFAANLVVAAAKLGAGLMTGSSALLAEAAHSVADSNNELLIGFSFRSAQRPADADHPLGYGRTRFLWAFFAAISSFLIGGCLSIGFAVNDLVHGGAVDNFPVAWVVLGVAALADGTSFLQTMNQARREAAFWSIPTVFHLRRSSDPTLRALAVEDGAALAGIVIAGVGLLVVQLGGPPAADAIASLLIGMLLGVTAIGLARPLADLLIGRSVPPQHVELARRTVAASPAVDEVRQLFAVYVAPQDAILTAKVRPVSGLSVQELARAMDELDKRLRSELPEIGDVFIDVTDRDSRDLLD